MPNRYTAAHASPKGPGDARPTALQIIKDEGLIDKLQDKTFVVTGTSSGIGPETAKAFAATGGTVICTVRNVEKGRAAMSESLSAPGSKIHLVEMDLNSLDSVRAAAPKILAAAPGGKINVLVCNAGVMTTPEGKTADGHETQFGTNHLAHFLLFQLLKDSLLSASTPALNSRVVNVSSMGHKYGQVRFSDHYTFPKGTYSAGQAYAQSKTANIWTANHIDRLYGSRGLHATSLHPGGIKSGLQVHMDDDDKKNWDEEPVKSYFMNVEQGAATSVYAAVGRQFEGNGGVYLEECDIARPEAETTAITPGMLGYKHWAYSPEDEARLWKDSLVIVGVDAESPGSSTL